MTESFISNFLPNVQKQQELLNGERQVLEQQAMSVACCCPSCSSPGPHPVNQHDVIGTATVVIVTLRAAHVVKLGRVGCLRCNRCFLPTATHLSCIPGTANGFTLQRTFDITPVWFHLELLSFLDAVQYHTKSAAIYSFVQSLVDQWEQQLRYQEADAWIGSSMLQAQLPAGQPAACSSNKQPSQLPVYVDTLQRNLGQALREYQYIMTRCETATERMDGWPLSARRPCGACVPGRIHVHYDMNFSLSLRRRGAYAIDYQQPPNSRLFMKNSEVTGFLDQLDKEQEQEAQQQQQQSRGRRRSSQQGVAVSMGQPLEPEQQQGTTEHTEKQPDAEADRQQESGADGGGLGQQEQQQRPVGCRAESGQQQQQRPDGGGAEPGQQQQGEWPATAHEEYRYECTEFKADQLIAHDSVKFLITAVAFAVCRHGHILLLQNCFTGERHGYGIACVHALLVAGVLIHFWWYDINCRWQQSFRKWLSRQAADIQEKFQGMRFPIPPFHLYAHKEDCRTRCGHLHMALAGRGTGENCERVGAEIGPHGLVTAYMAPRNREGRIERVCLKYTRLLDEGLSMLLVNMTLRAREEKEHCLKELRAAKEELCGILQQERPHTAQVQEQVTDLIRRAGAELTQRSTRLALGWEGQYVKARFILERVKAVEGSAEQCAPPLSLVLADTSLGKLKISNEALADAKRTLKRLVLQHLGGKHPDNADPVVQKGINQWLAAELKHGKEKVASTLAHARYADSLLQKLSKRPTEKKKVLARKQVLLAQANAGHAQLVEWCCWAGKLQLGGFVVQWDPQLAEEISSLANTTLQRLKEDTAFPWLPPADHGGPAQRIAHKAYLLECLQSRLEEELLLLELERSRVLTVLIQRRDLLKGALARHAPQQQQQQQQGEEVEEEGQQEVEKEGEGVGEDQQQQEGEGIEEDQQQQEEGVEEHQQQQEGEAKEVQEEEEQQQQQQEGGERVEEEQQQQQHGHELQLDQGMVRNGYFLLTLEYLRLDKMYRAALQQFQAIEAQGEEGVLVAANAFVLGTLAEDQTQEERGDDAGEDDAV